MKKMRRLGMLLMIVAAGGVGGCQQSLFSSSDRYTQRRIEVYWGGDSAVDARASRARASEKGFGFPTGMANQ